MSDTVRWFLMLAAVAMGLACSGEDAPLATIPDGLFLFAPDTEVPRPTLPGDASGPVRVAPRNERDAIATAELWVPLRQGRGLPGQAVLELPWSFDPLFFRIGGEQWTLEPERAERGWGLRLRLEDQHRGDAMIGFSTGPRRVHDGDGEILWSEHVKLLFHVKRRPGDEPVASPALQARFGLALELSPLIDPLPLQPGSELPIRLRSIEPLAPGVLVRAEHHVLGHVSDHVSGASNSSAAEVFAAPTDATGHVVLPIHAPGWWRVHATHRVEPEDGGPPHVHRTVLVFRTGAK